MQAEARFMIAAVMDSTWVQRAHWRLPVWRLISFVAGQAVAAGAPQRQCVHADAERQQWLWTGLELCLYRDSAESYWYNLVGRRPSLFLICREDAAGELSPCKVTADYDEAGAHMEADAQVFSAPIPPELHVQLEDFVMRHYRPQPPGKRKRTDWTEQKPDAWKPSPRLARR